MRKNIRGKKLIAVMLLCSMVMGLCWGPALAEDTSATDLYVFQYKGGHYTYDGVVQDSAHDLNFRWITDSGTTAQTYYYRPDGWRDYNIPTRLFEVVQTNEDGTENKFAAYCSDFLYGIRVDTMYRQMNLEDASYFYDDVVAQYIRGILYNGYWYDWTEDDLKAAETKANAWLEDYTDGSHKFETLYYPKDTEEPVEPIQNLTRDEALTATQLAIWTFANSEEDGWWMDFRDGQTLTPEDYVYDADASDDLDYIITGTNDTLNNNIKAFRKYLIHQQAEKAAPEDLLFNDEHFVSSYTVFTSSGEAHYDVIVRFQLEGAINQADNLNVTASIGDKTVLYQLGTEQNVSSDDVIVPDAAGYYTIQLSDITMEDADLAGNQVVLSLSGQQYLNGVYFYEAKPASGSARSSSQNLVGKYTGLTPVYAQAVVDFDLTGSKEAALQKQNAEGQPLSGAVFTLYAKAEDGTEYIPVKTGLQSTTAGSIRIAALPDDYTYYFRETKAPEGYQIADSGYLPAGDFSTPTVIVNTLIPKDSEPSEEPETPTAPGTTIPTIPDTETDDDIDTPTPESAPSEEPEEETIEVPGIPAEPITSEELITETEPLPTDVPRTGDPVGKWAALTVISGIGMLAMLLLSRKHKAE